MVDRYSVQSFPYAGNIIDHEGMWVTYYDYEALEAKLATSAERERVLVEENAYLKEYVTFLTGGYTKEEFKEVAKKYATPLNLDDAIDNIRDALAQVKGVSE